MYLLNHSILLYNRPGDFPIFTSKKKIMKKYNWGILGCGKIAEKFSIELKTLPNANLW